MLVMGLFDMYAISTEESMLMFNHRLIFLPAHSKYSIEISSNVHHLKLETDAWKKETKDGIWNWQAKERTWEIEKISTIQCSGVVVDSFKDLNKKRTIDVCVSGRSVYLYSLLFTIENKHFILFGYTSSLRCILPHIQTSTKPHQHEDEVFVGFVRCKKKPEWFGGDFSFRLNLKP